MSGPKVFREASEMRQFSRDARKAGKSVAFVPTMGCLHAGHLSLVQAARAKADVVVVSIYVNPTQFSQNEDFGVYPRTWDDDYRQLTEVGCEAIFLPTTLYAGAQQTLQPGSAETGEEYGGHETYIQVEKLQKPLCGRSRPHFFRGVATVVAKLFNIVEPDVAVFGQKDYQQWRVITRMVRDLDFAIEVVGMPTTREADGLAMSSRNKLLTEEHRKSAVVIPQGLQWAKTSIEEGLLVNFAPIHEELVRRFTEAGGRVDYVEAVDAEDLYEVEGFLKPVTIACAVFFGSVRLIDNIVVRKKR